MPLGSNTSYTSVVLRRGKPWCCLPPPRTHSPRPALSCSKLYRGDVERFASPNVRPYTLLHARASCSCAHQPALRLPHICTAKLPRLPSIMCGGRPWNTPLHTRKRGLGPVSSLSLYFLLTRLSSQWVTGLSGSAIIVLRSLFESSTSSTSPITALRTHGHERKYTLGGDR